MANRKKAFISGITGQDGSYLSEFLLKKGYEVHGMIRRSSTFNTDRIDHLYEDPHDTDVRLFIHYGDLSDPIRLRQLLGEIMPDEVYNLGAQSHVRVSFDQPLYTADIDALGTLRLLEAVRDLIGQTKKTIKIYQAGSSEMYGNAPSPQGEDTPFEPRSPYAVSKMAAHWYAKNYREAYDMFICNGILFNHESPRRGETFVTRKITRAATRIKLGLQSKLYLGNLNSKRDWGFAGDYVQAMWLMLQADTPDDYVVATGNAYSVQDFLTEAFEVLDLNWKDYVEFDSKYLRPTEVDFLLGDPSKIKRQLSWEPQVGFQRLVRMMVESDMELAQKEYTLMEAGFNTDPRIEA